MGGGELMSWERAREPKRPVHARLNPLMADRLDSRRFGFEFRILNVGLDPIGAWLGGGGAAALARRGGKAGPRRERHSATIAVQCFFSLLCCKNFFTSFSSGFYWF